MLDGGCDFAIATILKTEGSAPRKAGVKAIVDARGIIYGTIGGGQVEAEAQRRAVESIAAKRPQVFDFRMHGEGIVPGEPICGGFMRVLIDPSPIRHRTAIEAAAASLARRERGLLLTTIRQSPDCHIAVEFLGEQGISNEMGFPGATALRSALETWEAMRLVHELAPQATQLEILIEPIIPPPRLLIAGGGHIGQAVAWLARRVGFELIVAEDRPEFANPRLFPEGTTVRCGAFAGEIDAVPFDSDLYVVIVTRGHLQDAAALAACIRKPAAFIGMIGSRRKVAMLRKEFLGGGLATEAEFGRVYAPVGLDMGAVTVPEIAVSIVAQLISVRRLHRLRKSPIQS